VRAALLALAGALCLVLFSGVLLRLCLAAAERRHEMARRRVGSFLSCELHKIALTCIDMSSTATLSPSSPASIPPPCSDEPLVSCDYRMTNVSSTIDAALTMVMGDDMVKVVAWYGE
jgi:hypothetical protein